MKLTSFWTQGTVFWRVFNWDDHVHVSGNADGTFHDVGSAMSWSEDKFQLELKRDGVFGAIIVQASPNRVFHDADDMVLEDDGLRPFIHPSLRITLPIAGAHLDQSRLDRADKASLILIMGDLGRLVTTDDYLSDVRTFIVVKRQGFPDIDFEASVDSTVSGPILIEFNADLRIPHAGIAQILGELRSPSVSKRMLSSPVTVTVTATAQRDYVVMIDGQAVPGAKIGARVEGNIVEVAISAAASGFYSSVVIQSSLDGFQSRTPAIPGGDETRGGQSMHKWTASLYIGPNRQPRRETLRVIDVDFFGIETISSFDFGITDITPPTIEITEPSEDQPIVAQQVSTTNPLILLVRGTVRDTQSGYKDGTLTYSFAGQTNVPVVVVNGNGAWVFELAVASFGQYELTMFARDVAENSRLAVRQFEVVSSYKSKSIDELLAPTAYLNELLRFARSHLLTQGGTTGVAVDAAILTPAFMQPFGDIAQPNAPASERLISDLLTPVRILRDDKKFDSVGLIARWTFSELAYGAGDGFRNRAGRFGLNGIIHGVGNYADIVDRMRGKPGTDLESAVVLDSQSYAEVANHPVLEVGRDNRDFTVSFWIYPNDTGNGTWRQVLYKGHEPTWPSNVNRTFGIWLYPDSNTVHFRITTTGNFNDGGDSRTKLPTQRWSHLAYVKSGGMIRLYVNGRLDAEDRLAGDVVANSDPLFIGKSPSFDSFKGGLAELRLYGFALGSEDIEQLKLDRRSGMTETPIADYHEAVYEALLVGLGTSLEELRGLNALSAVQRRALAERLGLLTAGTPGDYLGSAVPNSVPGTDALEFWLAGTFGLPLTFTPTNPAELPNGFAFVVWARRESLTFQWALEDAQQVRPPELDPDLIDVADLSPKSLEWLGLLRARGVELAVQFETFDALLRAGSTAKALSQVYSAVYDLRLMSVDAADDLLNKGRDLVIVALVGTDLHIRIFDANGQRVVDKAENELISGETLTDLKKRLNPLPDESRLLQEQKQKFIRDATSIAGHTHSAEAFELSKIQDLSDAERAGEPIALELPRFNLDRKMFRRLLAYMGRLNVALTAHERDDFAHLLTQLWKVRTRYTAWKQEEAALRSRLWPTSTADAAWVPGSYKRDFRPWRGNAQQRADLEARLANRARAWQSIQDGQERAVAEAQRNALPLLRDGLLGIADLPSASQRMDDLTERWLVDFTATSATFVTPVEQATLSLQTLINGIRNGWYEANHAAHAWTIKPEYRRPDFDSEWQWLGTYGSWRSAVLSYLYPENLLFPELRQSRTVQNPKGSTSEFIIFLGELREQQPLTSNSLSTPPDAFKDALNALKNEESVTSCLWRSGLHFRGRASIQLRLMSTARCTTPVNQARRENSYSG